MMARNWKALHKAAEECAELGVELMKLAAFPSGKHPGRRRSVILSTEDELADVLGVVNFFIDKNRLDRGRIEKRARAKYKKFSKWLGEPTMPTKVASKPRKSSKKQAK